MRQIEFFKQTLKCSRLFKRIQVLTLDIFNEGNRCGCPGVQFAHYSRQLAQSGKLRGAPTPLSGNQLIVIAIRTQYHRLHDTLRTNRIGQFSQRLIVECLSWLKTAPLNSIDVNFDQFIALRRLANRAINIAN